MTTHAATERCLVRRDPHILSPSVAPIDLSRHAVCRYRERIRPALEHEDAHQDLRRLIKLGQVSTTPPSWLEQRAFQTAALYLVVGDVVLPLDPCRRDRSRLVALTCLARGGVSETARRRRNARRRRRPRDLWPHTHESDREELR